MTIPFPLLQAGRTFIQRVCRWLLLGAAVCVGWWAILYFLQDRLLFAARFAPDPAPGPTIPTTEVWTCAIEDGGQVEAWFIPAPGSVTPTTKTLEGASADPPVTDVTPRQSDIKLLSLVESRPEPGRRPVVVFFHGNAELIDQQGPIVDRYRDWGCHVLLVEYRGYGRSGGHPGETAIRGDALRFVDRLLSRPDVDRERVIYHGRSVGGGVAADLASVRPPRVLILESTFRSVEAMAGRFWAPPFLIKNPYRTQEVLRQAEFPTLIFHGSEDRIIPVEHGRALRDAARRGEYHEFPCDHNDLLGSPYEAQYWQRIHDFLIERGVLSGVTG